MRAEPIRCRAPMRNRRPPQLVGGVADFVRKLIIGHSSNTGSFNIKRFNWHGNAKTASEVLVTYQDRDFVVGGGGTGASNVDLTPYFNGAPD